MQNKKRLGLTALGLTALGLTLGLTICAAAAPAPAPAGQTVVLPRPAGEAGYWTPRAADLRRLERDLPPSLAGYDRQYQGVVQGGRRLILINGFSAALAPQFTGGPDDWHRQQVLVCDGGHDFFQATYDPRTRRLVGPDFNGVG